MSATVRPALGDLAMPEATIPQLQQVLNEPFMREFWQDYIPVHFDHRRSDIARCQIIEKRYSPGKWCVVTYSLTFGSEAEQHTFVLQVYADRGVACQLGRFQLEGVKVVPGLRARLWQFPHDPELRNLPALLNARRVQTLMPQRLFESLHAQGGCGLTPQALKYVPLKRSVVLVQVGRAGHGNHPKVLGKLDRDADGSSTFDTMQQLWVEQSHHHTAFAVVAPLEYDAQRRILWQSWSAGESFLHFAQRQGLSVACARVAEGLAALHRTPLRGLPVCSEGAALKKLRERAGLLMAFHPPLEVPLSRLLACLEDVEALRKPAVEVPIHGDFNHSQILFEDGKPTVLDFTSSCFGDPLYDVALFVAGLYAPDVLVQTDVNELLQAVNTFCQAYQSRVPWKVAKQTLRAQVATALICRRAYKVLTRLEKGASEKIEHYVNLAAQYFNQGE